MNPLIVLVQAPDTRPPTVIVDKESLVAVGTAIEGNIGGNAAMLFSPVMLA